MRSAVKKGGAADRPDIGGFVADRVEHGLVRLEDVSVPADAGTEQPTLTQ
jgi:hypothetical protein